MNGAIVQWGEKIGVPTPLNEGDVGADQRSGTRVERSRLAGS